MLGLGTNLFIAIIFSSIFHLLAIILILIVFQDMDPKTILFSKALFQ
jgi:hypothetical protein